MPPPRDPATDADDPEHLRAGLLALQEAARRGAAGAHFQVPDQERLLQLIVDAAMTLFGAQAASIALHDPEADRLTYRVAGGPHGAEVIGVSVRPNEGIVGYVFSTGEPLTLSDVATDPRFHRGLAEKTGYVPSTVAAVPLISEEHVVGVLQAFDKRSGETFTVRDTELLSAFAAQAGAAISATRVQRDLPTLLAESLRNVAPALSDDQVRELVGAATRQLDRDGSTPFWALVDQVSRLRDLGENELELVGDILEVVAVHQTHRSGWSGRR